jgi:hypothetical protein
MRWRWIVRKKLMRRDIVRGEAEGGEGCKGELGRHD